MYNWNDFCFRDNFSSLLWLPASKFIKICTHSVRVDFILKWMDLKLARGFDINLYCIMLTILG